MSLLVRRALATAAATATVLALAGCGGDDETAADKSSSTSSASDSSGPADASTGDSGDSEAAEESEAAASGEEVSGDEFAGLLNDAVDKATTAHVTMDLGETVGSGEGDADYTKAPPEIAMKLRVDALGGDIEMRLVGGTMYMKSPTSGDKWIATPLDDPNSPLAALGGNFDMKEQIELFADAVTSATYQGAEDVDGESLDHYTATVDTEKMLQNLPSAAAGQAEVPKSLTQDWWFDSDGLIRKFSSDLAGATTVMTLSDWGEDVDIEAPPSDEVATAPGGMG